MSEASDVKVRRGTFTGLYDGTYRVALKREVAIDIITTPVACFVSCNDIPDVYGVALKVDDEDDYISDRDYEQKAVESWVESVVRVARMGVLGEAQELIGPVVEI